MIREWRLDQVCLWKRDGENLRVKILYHLPIVEHGTQELTVEVIEGPLRNVALKAPITDLFELEA